ncbi:jg22621 [Pararge aegeria aegeria]|uniref:Jg22621 protein n=1 Tax=Pararge aegeria aegeria TaxID=348720 RepID=A0A8S4SB07_9NEOP|nr:jg22621 [Pararge aegeria aegeria]
MAAPAVVVKRAYKYYGRKDKPDYKPVLEYLDMTVEKGIIYGLLGPSGCGKTTLLSCIVGRRKLDSGEVWVLGGKPGEKGSGVPGPRVGYMPQDIALVAEFTVRDAVYYFGRIYGMKMKKLAEQFDFLTNLLELPSGGRLIKTLSGGQQRRVSLAAALVHEPELLILDEPTVGLDPVLRERIWEFLADQARNGTTVIITTHYIDETKQAHKTIYNSTTEAKNAVAKRIVYGAVRFPQNFSDALAIRVTEGRVEDDIIDESTISAWIDMSDHQITNFVKLQLHKAYEAFARRTMRACGKNEELVQIPVRFEKPIYGIADAEIVAYMAPGVMVTIIFFLAAIVTSTLMISDRLEGVWERSAVAGVQPKEMLQVHIVLQSLVILMQTIEMMIVAYLGYNLPYKGSLVTIACLLFLQGLGGMCFGFLLSVLCSSYTVSFFIATGSFYPMILLCGILWPIEGMPNVLRLISFALPFTIPAKSLRDLMEKGSPFTNPDIYGGFLITIAWIVGTLALCFLRLRFRKM